MRAQVAYFSMIQVCCRRFDKTRRVPNILTFERAGVFASVALLIAPAGLPAYLAYFSDRGDSGTDSKGRSRAGPENAHLLAQRLRGRV